MVDVGKLLEETKKLKLLYVEDNREARESTLLILNDMFDDIVVAEDGRDGLQKYKNGSFDIVITDISMPNMDGLEMSKNIKEIDYSQSIIVLTALSDISAIKNAIDINIDAFVNKPLIDLEILFAKIDKIIKKINYEKAKIELEKAHLIFDIIKNISHHWKQPLSIISTISSGYSVKLENGIEVTKKDLEDAQIITQQVEELSSIFNTFNDLDLENLDIHECEKLLKIGNPIYS